jgi:DNA primase
MDLLGSIRNLEAIGSRFRTSCIFPDHEDSTPSFVLYPENNSFYCFGCDEWGDSLDLERSFKSGLLPPSSWRTAASAA